MPDREKVIKGLECCRRGFCFACPYNDGADNARGCKQKWADDTLALLKAQQNRIEELEQLVRMIDIADTDKWGGRTE